MASEPAVARARILILGIGNILLGDEGFGVHAEEYLKEGYLWPDNVRLVDGATLGLLLMGELMECDLAIILDVAQAGNPPGTFYYLEDQDLSPALGLGESMHQTSIADILISCDLAGHRPRTLVFCMEPFDIGAARCGLTPQAKELLPAFCEKVVACLQKMGVAARKIR